MIEINNLTKFKINKKSFSQVAKIVLKGENRESKIISLAFIGKKEMQGLNKKYRGKNCPTDVLSFGGINEIVICPKVVAEKKENLTRVFIHGILHLCGYDHQTKKDAKKMQTKEKQYPKISKS